MSIHPTTPQDLPQIIDLINLAFIGLENGVVGWTSERDMISGHRVSLQYPDELTNTDQLRVLKYVQDGQILGCVRVQIRNPEEAFLGLLSVHPEAQSRGIGAKLLKAGEDWAMECGVKFVHMTVFTCRENLLDFYRRKGYVQKGDSSPMFQRKESGKLKGSYEYIVLEKILAQ